MADTFALVLHGGAGAQRGRDYSAEIAHMRGLVEAARDRLLDGASALDVAVETIVELEISGLYVAGRGASPNTAGKYELDASLMDGASGEAGAVAALQGFTSPIRTARAVMERTHHVMLAGEGAAMFAAEHRLEAIPGDPGDWFTHAGADEDNHATGARKLTHGTVGCAVLDREGRLAAGTSTGGVFDKMPGRLGDTPVIGAGTWADGEVAVSSTGSGEFFLRTATAVQVAHRLRWAGQDLAAAAEAAIASVGAIGGDGGLIAVDRQGRIAMPYNSQGMKRAALHPDGRITSAAFED